MSNKECYIKCIMSILNKISKPADLRDLTAVELEVLAGELRERIISVSAANGGHLAPNLGTVELTVAMLRCFDLPEERIIWDVGHQSYSYKLLTGRAEKFEKLRQFNGCCGFPVRNENAYECYGAGHAGVAIPAALGMCAAQTPDDRCKVIAVVGDGAIASGVALEGLNQVRTYGRNLVIILNDNKMAISTNVGALSKVLNRMMTSYRYRWIKNCTKTLIKLLPKSQSIINFIKNLEDAAKHLLLPSEPFESLGIRYLGPINGHNIHDMERAFRTAKADSRPVIIHIITQKGKGYAPAEANPERFHGVSAFDPADGSPKQKSEPGFSAAFGKAACKLAEKNTGLSAVVAAMTGGVGLNEFAKKYPERFYDAGMAESHAVSFSSGLAAAGKPVICAIYATFIQRSLDNIFHDVCLMDLPVTFVLDRAGLVEDGPTHHGIYDLGFLLGMKNLTIMQPACEEEVGFMLEYAVNSNAPAVIRYPRGSSGAGCRNDIPLIKPIEKPACSVWRNGSDLAIHAVGAEAVRALEIADLLQEEYHLSVKVVNVRFLKPFAGDILLEDLQNMPVFTLEDHTIATGFGAIAARTALKLTTPYILQSFGIDNNQDAAFGSVNELRKSLNLDSKYIAGAIFKHIQTNRIGFLTHLNSKTKI
ncbi:MAG: 1-deoxy-D-xylulose-5-phosphate synthase [Lentisphaerae bacterium]|nr:1-deoxy-D-xylulose-5-phosphate synthase [Lentisphaerota bacterium]